MRIEYYPALSPRRASRRLQGSPARSARVTAALRISNPFQPCRSKPWNARTNSPLAKSSVRLSLKPRIIGANILDMDDVRQASTSDMLATRGCWMHGGRGSRAPDQLPGTGFGLGRGWTLRVEAFYFAWGCFRIFCRDPAWQAPRRVRGWRPDTVPSPRSGISRSQIPLR